MSRSLLTIFTLVMVQICCAQYGNIWTFGKMQGIDFNSTEARLISTGINQDSLSKPRRFNEGHSTSISDCNGQLLFYSNGVDIWNRKDSLMENGNLAWSYPTNIGSRKRACMIVPIPNSSTRFYLFYMVNPGTPGNEKFCFAEIDLSYNAGLGMVVFKDSMVNNIANASANLTFARHANDTDIWIITTPDQNNYHAYRIDKNGLNINPVVSSGHSQIAKTFPNTIEEGLWGFIKMTNDYNRLIVSDIVESNYSNGHVLMYSFDRKTGKLSNEVVLVDHNDYPNQVCRSIAISPNDSFIYLSVEPLIGYTGKFFSSIIQINRYTKQRATVYNFKSPLGFTGNGATPNGRLGMQTAPDGKIYICLINKIYRVMFPNKRYSACRIRYWDSLQYMNYEGITTPNDMNIFSLPNIFMPERKLYFNSSTDLKPCTDTTVFTYWGDTTYYKLVWYFGDGDSLVQTQPIKYGAKIKHVYKQDGQYEISLNSWHAVCNKRKKYTDSITVKLKPGFKLLQKDPAAHACYSDTLGINYQSIAGNVLIIDWGDNTSDNLNIKDSMIHKLRKSYTLEKTYKLQYTLAAPNACFIERTDSFNAIFHPKPILDLKVSGYSGAGVLNGKPEYKGCEPLTLDFKDNSSLFKSVQIYWYNGDSTLSDIDSITNKIFNNSAGLNATSGLNTFQTTNIFNCVSKDTFYTLAYSKPVAGFSLDTASLCLRNNLFNVVNKTQYQGFADSLKYRFEWGDGKNLSEFPNFGHSYKFVGPQLLKLNVSGEYACSDTSLTQLDVFPHPASEFDILKNVQCLNGNNFELIVQSNDEYQFDWGDGNTNPFVLMSQGQLLNHAYSVLGKFNIRGIAKNTYGCIDTQTAFIHVKQHPKVDFNLNDTSACFSLNQFVATTNISYPDMDSVSSVIHFGDGWTFAQPKGNFTKNYTYNSPGNYFIKLVSTSNYGCLDSNQREIRVMPEPVLSLSTTDVCFGDSVIFDAKWQSNDQITGFSWKSPEINSIDGNAMQNKFSDRLAYLYDDEGTYTMTFEARNVFDCSALISEVVQVYPLPVADFEFVKTESNPGNIIYQFYDKSRSANNWFWDFDGQGNSSSQNPLFAFTDTGFSNVILRISDLNGCSDSVIKIVTVFPDFKFYFPNAISLNDDFLNETFGTNSPQFIFEYELEIYNRWGELVFKTTDKYQDWRPDMEGVYLYKIKVKDLFLKLHFYSGTVTVLK